MAIELHIPLLLCKHRYLLFHPAILTLCDSSVMCSLLCLQNGLFNCVFKLFKQRPNKLIAELTSIRIAYHSTYNTLMNETLWWDIWIYSDHVLQYLFDFLHQENVIQRDYSPIQQPDLHLRFLINLPKSFGNCFLDSELTIIDRDGNSFPQLESIKS